MNGEHCDDDTNMLRVPATIEKAPVIFMRLTLSGTSSLIQGASMSRLSASSALFDAAILTILSRQGTRDERVGIR